MKDFNEFELEIIKELVKVKIIETENLLKENITTSARDYYEYTLGVYKKIIKKIGGNNNV